MLGRENKTILIPLQFAVCAAITLYLVHCRVELQRRNQRSWQQIVSRFSPALQSIETARRISATAPRVAFRNAGVMMEIADYAERNSSGLDIAAIEGLRSHALSVRFSALKSFGRRTSQR
jgi:predicted Ser/Thr protein kinase